MIKAASFEAALVLPSQGLTYLDNKKTTSPLTRRSCFFGADGGSSSESFMLVQFRYRRTLAR